MPNTSIQLQYGTRCSVTASNSSHRVFPLIKGNSNSMVLYVGFSLHSIRSVVHAHQRQSLHMQSFLYGIYCTLRKNICNLPNSHL